MAEQFVSRYIPAGCLLIPVHEYPILSPLISSTRPRRWYFFKRHSDDLPESLCLPEEFQNVLLESPGLAPFAGLWSQRSIQFAFAIQSPATALKVFGRVRVYILPHDVNRSMKNCLNEVNKSMSTLLRQLEYSQDCWQGGNIYNPQSEPTLLNPIVCPPNTSLLTLFNQVPSPDPHPEEVSDPDLQWTMQGLLESQIPGLTTTLHPYQGRSVALMLQRELEPGRVIDPRLRSALDQAGQPWYYDDVSGLPLREPRFYDGAQGGILAEEMGTGKTLICLALILSTKSDFSRPPEPLIAETSPRSTIGSLMDMAAAAANKHAVSWRSHFEAFDAQLGYDYRRCKEALIKPENRAFYKVRNTLVEPRRSSRIAPREVAAKKVYLGYATLIVVPANLVKQWQNEIAKHTTGLNVLVLVNRDPIPSVAELLSYDIILFSDSRFERIQKDRENGEGPLFDIYCPLEYIRFKRCIIDEGHKLGNGGRKWKNDVMRVIERLEISARWVVTGTPSRGLYGIDANDLNDHHLTSHAADVALKQEHDDINRIGNLAAKYLIIRPWANAKNEVGDHCANWYEYIKKYNRRDCLINTLNSLLVRHRLADISTLLPEVHEKVVVLNGSFQDQLSLNLFSMMIIFNSVQSQRTDADYLFHPRHRGSLVQLVKNLRQASFFGGVFFSADEISKAVETAEGFLIKKKVRISTEDEILLRQAICFGKQAAKNHLKNVSNQFRTMPLFLKDFPCGKGKSWSLDDQENEDGLVCTDATLTHAAQEFLTPCIDAPTSLQVMVDSGRLDQQGRLERAKQLSLLSDDEGAQGPQSTALAGNTISGDDHHVAPISKNPTQLPEEKANEQSQAVGALRSQVEIAGPLAETRIISTVSEKLSYLIDSVIKYQESEQILIFYDNDNVAFYLASVFEILQIQHLIYSRAGLSAGRRAQYVATFTHSTKFRVLLMDITQAAFGLDMRSASRIYFISPVLNPQVMAQAIGRARRISQQKPVSVETLVLRNSIEEVIIDRRKSISQAEHSRIKNVLDDGPIKEWIRNPKIHPMSDAKDGFEQTAPLASPQYIFGRGFGRPSHPDEDIIMGSPDAMRDTNTTEGRDDGGHIPFEPSQPVKRNASSPDQTGTTDDKACNGILTPERPTKRRMHVAWAD